MRMNVRFRRKEKYSEQENGGAVPGGDTFMDIPDVIDEELPFN